MAAGFGRLDRTSIMLFASTWKCNPLKSYLLKLVITAWHRPPNSPLVDSLPGKLESMMFDQKE